MWKSNRLRGLPRQLCSTDSDHMTEGIPAVHFQIVTKRQQQNVHVRISHTFLSVGNKMESEHDGVMGVIMRSAVNERL